MPNKGDKMYCMLHLDVRSAELREIYFYAKTNIVARDITSKYLFNNLHTKVLKTELKNSKICPAGGDNYRNKPEFKRPVYGLARQFYCGMLEITGDERKYAEKFFGIRR